MSDTRPPEALRCVATKPRLDPTLPPKQCARSAKYGEWCRQHAESLGGWRLAPPDWLAAHPVPDSGPATDDLATAAAFMLELVDQYYGTDHEFDIPEEAQFRYHRAVIEEATR